MMMMSTSSDPNVIGALNGMNINKVNNTTLDMGFQWVAPKTGIAASLFPSASTYHPLYDYTRSDLVGYLINIDKANIPDNMKQQYRNEIKNIVESVPKLAAMSTFYILCIIALIIYLVVGTEYPKVLGTVVVLGILQLGYAMFMAEGTGVNNWMDFSNQVASRQATGQTLEAVMRGFVEEENRDKDRMAMQQMNNRNNNNNYNNNSNNGFASFTGAAFGSMLGSRR